MDFEQVEFKSGRIARKDDPGSSLAGDARSTRRHPVDLVAALESRFEVKLFELTTDNGR